GIEHMSNDAFQRDCLERNVVEQRRNLLPQPVCHKNPTREREREREREKERERERERKRKRKRERKKITARRVGQIRKSSAFHPTPLLIHPTSPFIPPPPH